MRKFFIKIFSSIFPTRKSHWEADEIRNKTHKIKSRTYGLYWSASLASNFRSLLPELNGPAALATELLTQAASCTYDPDVPPFALLSPACHTLLPHLRAHKEVWAAELSPPLIALESSQARFRDLHHRAVRSKSVGRVTAKVGNHCRCYSQLHWLKWFLFNHFDSQLSIRENEWRYLDNILLL